METPKRLSPHHPVLELFKDLACWESYPPGVVAVPKQILGTSFVPGGTGLWCEGNSEVPHLPVGGVMVLGHDFHNVAGYEWSHLNVAENLESPTWKHLLKLLKRVPISLERCFFTNIYMGLCEGDATTGRFPGSLCPNFKQRCREFFIKQIEMQRPSVILALGKWVPEFLASLSPQLHPWIPCRTLKAIDSAGLPLRRGVSFTGVSDHECVVVSLVHPCFRPSNINRRTWKDLRGDAAELEMLQLAMS